jgi:hypothetical protein
MKKNCLKFMLKEKSVWAKIEQFKGLTMKNSHCTVYTVFNRPGTVGGP